MLRGFRHQGSVTQAADNPVPLGKVPSIGRSSRGIFRHEAAGLGNQPEQLPVGSGINHIHPAAQHHNGLPFPVQGAVDGCRINAGSTASHHQTAAGTDLCADAPGGLKAVTAGLSGTHHPNEGPFLPPEKFSPVVQHHRRLGDVFQLFRVRPVAVAQNPDSLFLAGLENPPGFGQILLFQSLLHLRFQAPGQPFPAAVIQFLRGGEPFQQSCLLKAAKPRKHGKPNPVQQHSPHPLSLFTVSSATSQWWPPPLRSGIRTGDSWE